SKRIFPVPVGIRAIVHHRLATHGEQPTARIESLSGLNFIAPVRILAPHLHSHIRFVVGPILNPKLAVQSLWISAVQSLGLIPDKTLHPRTQIVIEHRWQMSRPIWSRRIARKRRVGLHKMR